MIVLYAWQEKRGQPFTLKMFDKMPEPNWKKGGLGFEAWLIKIVLTLSILQVLLYICGQMLQRNNLKAALGLSKTDENY